ncbi:VOC family protein [Kribbella lupini]|uniref:VOC family protein n=1 Tax=Kribbella lupini TaxID=291602 RepID=A0ABN2B0P7_9ACTN
MGERPAAVGDLRLATIVVNALDMERAATFWAETLGYDAEREVGPQHQYTKLEDPAGRGPDVLIQQTEKIPQDAAPVHIDLYTSDRDQHVERLLKLGATRADDWDYPERHEFIVLRDPEGNEFCVIQAD